MPNPHRAKTPVQESDRRQYERRPASEFPHVSARLLGGPQVKLIDLSTRGVLLETSARLLPGASVVLRFVAPDTELTLRGCVVRSSVGHLSNEGLRYHTALNFAEDLSILDSGEAPGSTSRPQLQIVSSRSGEDADTPATALTPIELVAMVSHTGPELRDLLAANDW